MAGDLQTQHTSETLAQKLTEGKKGKITKEECKGYIESAFIDVGIDKTILISEEQIKKLRKSIINKEGTEIERIIKEEIKAIHEETRGRIGEFKAGLPSSAKLVNKAEQKVKNAKQKAKEAIAIGTQSAGRKFFEKYVPFGKEILNFFYPEDEVIVDLHDSDGKEGNEGFGIKKFFAGALAIIGGVFSVFGPKDSLAGENPDESSESGGDGNEGEKGGGNGRSTGSSGSVKSKDDSTSEEVEPVAPVVGGEEKKKPLLSDKTKENIYYHTGGKFLIGLSGVDYSGNPNKGESLDAIKGVKLGDLTSLDEKKKKSLFSGTPDKLQLTTLDTTIEAFNSEKVRKLLIVGLTPRVIKKILQKKDGTIKEKLATYFDNGISDIQKIIDSLGNPDFLENLTIKELSVLYIRSIPALGLLSIDELNLGGFKEEITSLIFDSKIDISELEEEIPVNIIKSFNKSFGGDLKQLGGNNLMKNSEDSRVKNEVGKDLNNEEKGELGKIIDFKDYLYGNGDAFSDFLNNEKLMLTEDQKNLFIQNLDYRWVIALYEILGGEHSLENLNPMSLPIIVFTIGNIIGMGDKENVIQKVDYIGTYAKEVLLKGCDSGLSEDEVEVMKIYRDKLLNLIYTSYLNSFYKKIGLLKVINNDLMITAGILIGTGVTFNIASSIMIKKTLGKGKLPIISGLTKKAGWISIILGALTGITESAIMYKTGSFFSDTQKALKEGKVEEVLKAIEKHKNSVKEYKTNDGKDIILITYDKKAPYVIYDKKVWGIGILDSSGNISASLLNYTENILKDSVSEKTSKIKLDNGNYIDDSIVRIEGNNIIFGNTSGNEEEYKFDIVSFFEGKPLLNEKIDKSTYKKALEEVNRLWESTTRVGERQRQLPYYDIISGVGKKEITYIKMDDGPQENYLALVKIGDLPECE